jgi:hypothetical protein
MKAIQKDKKRGTLEGMNLNPNNNANTATSKKE